MTITFNELSHLLREKRIAKNTIPLILPRQQVRFVLNRSRGSGPFAVEAGRAKGRELGGLSEAQGLNGVVNFGVGVLEIERKVGFEGKDGLFLSNKGFVGGFVWFWGFGNGREGRVVTRERRLGGWSDGGNDGGIYDGLRMRRISAFG